MDASLMRRWALRNTHAGGVDWRVAWTWLLCFGSIVYLGLKGGGYDTLVHGQVGVAIWWIVLAAVVVGAVPRQPLGRRGWTALGLLALFALWTCLSLAWTESIERTWADLARVLTYVGILALAFLSWHPRQRRHVVGAVAAGIMVVGVVALLSRFHPGWFPAAQQTGEFLASGRERLSYPLNYWNGLAALLAIGLPLYLQMAAGARSIVVRGLAAAALPAVALTIFLTLSRGGIGAAILVVVVFVAFTSNRFSALFSLALGAAGGAALILAAAHRDALQHGYVGPLATHQGTEMAWITMGVCLIVGIVQAAVAVASRRWERPRWTVVPRRHATVATAVCLLAAIAIGVAAGVPGRVSNAWSEFKRGGTPGNGTNRLTSAAGQNRYQYWSAAVDENATQPLTGTGSGTFEYWWTRHGTTTDTVRDTHSLYFQTLGELGIVGLLLIAAIAALVLVGGGAAAVRAGPSDRPLLAAALAGALAFFVTAAVDWMWQLPVVPVAMLLLIPVLLGSDIASAAPGAGAFRVPGRLLIAILSLAVIGAIAVPVASTSLVRKSQTDARSGRLANALSEARTAQNVEPGAASPRLQEALVLEAEGRLVEASAAARAATAREATNWRNWAVLSRLEAERGRASAAVRAYRKARSLNPRSSLFSH